MEDDDAAPDPLAETLRVKVLQDQVEALRMELADAKAEVSPTFFFTFGDTPLLCIWGGIFGSFPRHLTKLPPCPVLSCSTGEGCGGGA